MAYGLRVLPPPSEKVTARAIASEKLQAMLPKKSAARRTLSFARIEQAKLELLAMRGERNFARATPIHLVALWAWCHTETYQVAPSLTTKEWSQASILAGVLVKNEFDGKTEKMIDFLRWTWAEERRNAKWRLENGRSVMPLGWRLQFSPKHVVKWRANGGK